MTDSEAPNEALVVLVTAPNDDVAKTIARALVEQRLAACVSVLSGATSVYRWEGAIEEETETQLVIKTRRARVDALIARVAQLHPYDVPEVIALPVVAGLAPYLAWIGEETPE